jgi:hypothetical protein
MVSSVRRAAGRLQLQILTDIHEHDFSRSNHNLARGRYRHSHCDIVHIIIKHSILFSAHSNRSEGHDQQIVDSQSDRAHRCNLNSRLHICLAFGRLYATGTVRQSGVERSMAMHQDCRNPDDLHQEAQLRESVTPRLLRRVLCCARISPGEKISFRNSAHAFHLRHSVKTIL